MTLVSKTAIYFHTMRYLRPVQIYGRAWFKLYRPRPSMDPAPSLRAISGNWVPPAAKPSAMVSPSGFRFLNEFHELKFPQDWNNPNLEKLWLYNLHYFDVLNSEAAEEQRGWHRALIERWIRDNPPGVGNGWEPYPSSLRIVNWVKWALAGNRLEETWIDSLAVQVRYLSRRLEWHLLGNHLFANVKALVFAGIFFEGEEASRWLAKGLEVLERELNEQILPDGGHFELSPMYHSIILEDLLDLLNLFTAYPEALADRWQQLPERIRHIANRMLRWLAAMSHPDGEIALFNDAAFGIAPAPAELDAYARRLSLPGLPVCRDGIMSLEESGYCRCQIGEALLIVDVGRIGPDYLPGHAHADTLGFEMSLFGQRLFVDSGTSCYGNGKERLRQRSTAAHNTLTIDGQDSSEVWGGFRVARRARPIALRISNNNDQVSIGCSHDGFKRLPGRPIHRREWHLGKGEMRIRDFVEGRFGRAVARYHLHPDVCVDIDEGGKGGRFRLPCGRELAWYLRKGRARLVSGTYHPRFGVTLPNRHLEVEVEREGAEFGLAWK